MLGSESVLLIFVSLISLMVVVGVASVLGVDVMVGSEVGSFWTKRIRVTMVIMMVILVIIVCIGFFC